MRVKHGWLALFLFGVLMGCQNDPGTLGLSNSTFNKDFNVIVVDTITVKVSTVRLDSLPTSNTGILLVGGYDDAKLGRTQGEAYLQIGTGSGWTPPTEATFDSLVLIAHYSGYTYGDTSYVHKFEVRRVTQPFQIYTLPQFYLTEQQYSALYTSNSKFNTSAMRADMQPLGTRTLRSRAHSKDSVTVRLSDELGRQWLTMSKDQSPDIVEESRFLDYFKGISIGTDGTDQSVLGINTTNLRIRLYYKSYVGEELTQSYHDFPFETGLYNYTRVITDRSNTALSSLSLKNNELSTSQTDNMAFIQAGSGLVTKLTFPYLTRLLRLTNVLLVNQAQIIIEPVKGTYDDKFPLPKTLTLYHTDKSNLPIQRVSANYNVNAFQAATISFDKEFDTSTGYQFTVTQLAQALLSTDGDSDRGLLITIPPEEISKTFGRAYIGAGGDYRVRLKVWYTKAN
jgi:hypothetical protein